MDFENNTHRAGRAFRPSFLGYVETLREAMILCEACLQGSITYTSRRPSVSERVNLVRSGHVFVVKKSSRSKKWTDGMAWAPCIYTHDGFKVYHESNNDGILRKEGPETYGQLGGSCPQSTRLIEQNRMIKKALKISIRGTDLQVISYYTVEDVISNNLPTPSQDRNLQGVRLRQALIEIYAAALGGPSLFAENEFYGRPSSPRSSPTKTGSRSHSPPTQTASFSVGHQPKNISSVGGRMSELAPPGIQRPAPSPHNDTWQATAPHSYHDYQRIAHVPMGPPPRVLQPPLPGLSPRLGVQSTINNPASASMNPYIEGSIRQNFIPDDDQRSKVFNQEDVERSKMLRNVPYNYFDPTLENERRRCAEAVARYTRAYNPDGGLREEEIHNILMRVFDPAQDTTHAFLSAPRVKGTLGPGVKIEAPFTCRYGYNINIMDDVHIERNCDIDDSGRVDIGRQTWIGPHVCILTSVLCNGSGDDGRSGAQRSARPVWIGPKVQIGARALICAGVRLEEGTIVEPGAVVSPNYFHP
jgi:acetyltransferase-like isoleucine patch superfamily enzyme